VQQVGGFQPAVFDNKAGQPAWSPFWNHFTLKWTDENNARVIRTSAEIRDLINTGELEKFNGVPDSHPNGFVVNCPAPILAPNTFEGYIKMKGNAAFPFISHIDVDGAA